MNFDLSFYKGKKVLFLDGEPFHCKVFVVHKKKDKVKTEGEACKTHNKIGKIVRKAIKEVGRNYARRFANPKKEFKTIRKRR